MAVFTDIGRVDALELTDLKVRQGQQLSARFQAFSGLDFG